LAPKNHPIISVVSVLNQGSIFSFIVENKERAHFDQLEEEGPFAAATF